MTSIAVSDDSFDTDVLKAEGSVLVDFWAEWCGPCKMISPALEEIAKEMDGRVRIAKMNIDDNPVTPSRYEVRAIPTILAFQKGQVIQQLQGVRPKAEFEEMAQKLL